MQDGAHTPSTPQAVGSYADDARKVVTEIASNASPKSETTNEQEIADASQSDQQQAAQRLLDLSFLLKQIEGNISLILRPQKLDANAIKFKNLPSSVRVDYAKDGSILIQGQSKDAEHVLSDILLDLGSLRATTLNISVSQKNSLLVDTKIVLYASATNDSKYRTQVETKGLQVAFLQQDTVDVSRGKQNVSDTSELMLESKSLVSEKDITFESITTSTVGSVSISPAPTSPVVILPVTPNLSLSPTSPAPALPSSTPPTPATGVSPTLATPVTTTPSPVPSPSPATAPSLPAHIAPLQNTPGISAFTRTGSEDAATIFTAAHFTSAYSDPEGDALVSITVTSLPANGDLRLSGVNITAGQVILAADLANITFVPTGNWNGTTSFYWKAFDGHGHSTTELVNITLSALPDAPDAVNDSPSVNEDATTANLVTTLLSNDTDPDTGATRTITAVDTTGTVGTVSFNAGTQTLTFTADNNAHDSLAVGQSTTTSFTYTITDNDGLTDTATVTMTVNGVNDAPVLASALVDQVINRASGGSYQFAVGSFTDIDATDSFTYTAHYWDGAAWAALPAWLAFNPTTRTFTVAAAAGVLGGYDVRVTATDPHSVAVTDNFDLIIADVTNTGIGTGVNNVMAIGTGSGADNIWGNTGDDRLYGLAGNDTLDGGLGIDSLYGGAGNDRFVINNIDSTFAAPDIIMDFTAGADTIRVVGFNAIGTAAAAGATLQYSFDGTHTVVQGANGFGFKILGNHTLSAANFVFLSTLGTTGNDTINGTNGTDGIDAGDGDDYIYGGAPNTGAGSDIIYGGAGNDTIQSGYRSDTLYGGAGNDIFYYEHTDASWRLSFNNYLTDYIADFTQGQDLIHLKGLGITGIVSGAATGNSAGYTYDATNDWTYIQSPHYGYSEYGTIAIYVRGNIALSAADFIFSHNTEGTGGADNLTLGAAGGLLGLGGNDTLTGTAGMDYIAGNDGDDEINDNSGDGGIYGGAGNDTINAWGSGADIGGGDGDDVIYASSNRSTGDNGNDTIYGGASANFGLYGQAGNDVVDAGGGDDPFIEGGPGTDTLTGGTGIDVFWYRNNPTESGVGAGVRDIITDFTQGTDRINISLLPNTFTFIGTSAFTAGATTGIEVRYDIDVPGNRTIIQIDRDVAVGFDMEIELTGQITLVGGDFLL